MRKIHLARVLLMAAIFAAGITGHAIAAPDSDVCPVHKVKMQRVDLKLVYGMPSPKEFEDMRVAKEKFPYGKDYRLAGCVVKPAKTVEGFLCADCVKAREKWLKSHGKK